MQNNLAMIRSSLCSNPSLMDRITLYPVALGTSKQTCWTFSGVDNAVRACELPRRKRAPPLVAP